MPADLAFPSGDWVAAYHRATTALPVRTGTTARVVHVVTGAPDGDVTWWVAFVDGRAVASGREAGTPEAPPADTGDDPPAVTITMPSALAASVARGEVELPAAFMQGRAKVAGDQAALLRVLALTATPEYRTAARALADATAP